MWCTTNHCNCGIYCGFLTNKLGVGSYVTSYELCYSSRVTVYCTSYKLHVGYKLQVTNNCMSYDLFLT